MTDNRKRQYGRQTENSRILMKRRNSNGKSGFFAHGKLEGKCPRATVTTDNRKWPYSRFGRQFAISGYPSLSQLLGAIVENAKFVVGILTLIVIVSEI